jgi:hypothetical protein
MLSFFGSKLRFCDRIHRRGFLKVGALGLGGLTLADLLRLRAEGVVRPTSAPKSVIMVFLYGGPSHIDTFDMKPDAPVEYRGEFKPVQTSLSGLNICEHLPLTAKIADKMALIRNLSFLEYTRGHNPELIYTGYEATSRAITANRPSFGAVVSRLRGKAVRDMPPFVAFDGYSRVGYVGLAHRPFVPGAQTGALGPVQGMTPERMADRKELLRSFDGLRRDLDNAQGGLAAMDTFTARALDMVTTPKARDAFDINQEPASVRAKYGKATQFLQARRLVEAGVQVVTLTSHNELHSYDGAGTWDHHGGIFPALRQRLPELDQRLYALITDIYERGLDRDVAVVIWGEMGRTPRVGNGNNPGRDHWCDAGFALVAGGGLKMGQVIGATTARAERPSGQPYTPQNMLATLYAHVLGIDPATTLPDLTGRPMFLLDNRAKIAELV